MFVEVGSQEGYALTVDLEKQIIIRPSGTTIAFNVDSFRKYCLLNGLDDIGLTLKDAGDLSAFEKRWKEVSPWYFGV